MRTLIDEYGDTGVIQPETHHEIRRDGSGRVLGPKPADLATLSYDLKQVLSPREPRLPVLRGCACARCAAPRTDISGTPLAE